MMEMEHRRSDATGPLPDGAVVVLAETRSVRKTWSAGPSYLYSYASQVPPAALW